MRQGAVVVATLAALLAATTAGAAIPVETYTLPNGLTVILHEDHALPEVTVNVWYGVGSKDERAGRTGFAHLFEHLMFMGTSRVPGNQFDMLMESGGGANNASTSNDRTNYYSWGPSSLLPTLLWLDADRLEGLGKAMTVEKLDLQRSVVRNERRQGVDNAPYGLARVVIPAALYPEGHPYHHPVIGSHEDLAAATLEDVKEFFATYYVPGNASLVVAGDFEPAQAKALIARLFGAVAMAPLPDRVSVPPARLDAEIRRVAADRVKYPRLYLVWHSPAAFSAADGAMVLIARVLVDGSAGRLFKRLVLDDRLAQTVEAFQDSRQLGSEFHVEATAAEGIDLERVKRAVLEELDRFKREGPTEAEVSRAKAATESEFLRRKEGLGTRADMLNEFWVAYGAADSFDRELSRRLAPTRDQLREAARQVLGDARLDLRILPQGLSIDASALDTRPEDLPSGPAKAAVPQRLTLGNGVPLFVASHPGSGLFAGYLIMEGGERLVAADKAGLAALTATMLTKGAGTRDAAGFAEAVAALGATIEPSSSWHGVTVGVTGLASRLGPTLDLFADAVLHPRLDEADFARERDLALARIRAREDSPRAVADCVSRILIFSPADPRGRPTDGLAGTVKSLSHADVIKLYPQLVNPARAALVFVGDFTAEAIKEALDNRLGRWQASAPSLSEVVPATRVELPEAVLVHRPGAAQTVLFMARPVAATDVEGRAVRRAVTTLFGGSFTSRLMQNIREKHGFSYGARSAITQDGSQLLLTASSSVQTAVTAAALAEFKKEFESIASGNVTPWEWSKAVRTVRYSIETAGETTSALASALANLVEDGLPSDELATELDRLIGTPFETANREARSGVYAWGSLLIVMVGDKEQVLPQLEKAGFARPRLVDVEGRAVAD